MVGSMLLITIIGSILFEMDLLQQIMIRSGTALFAFFYTVVILISQVLYDMKILW